MPTIFPSTTHYSTNGTKKTGRQASMNDNETADNDGGTRMNKFGITQRSVASAFRWSEEDFDDFDAGSSTSTTSVGLGGGASGGMGWAIRHRYGQQQQQPPLGAIPEHPYQNCIMGTSTSTTSTTTATPGGNKKDDKESMEKTWRVVHQNSVACQTDPASDSDVDPQDVSYMQEEYETPWTGDEMAHFEWLVGANDPESTFYRPTTPDAEVMTIGRRLGLQDDSPILPNTTQPHHRKSHLKQYQPTHSTQGDQVRSEPLSPASNGTLKFCVLPPKSLGLCKPRAQHARSLTADQQPYFYNHSSSATASPSSSERTLPSEAYSDQSTVPSIASSVDTSRLAHLVRSKAPSAFTATEYLLMMDSAKYGGHGDAGYSYRLANSSDL